MAEPRKDELVALAFCEFAKLMADALTARRLFEAAELALPAPLERLFSWEPSPRPTLDESLAAEQRAKEPSRE